MRVSFMLENQDQIFNVLWFIIFLLSLKQKIVFIMPEKISSTVTDLTPATAGVGGGISAWMFSDWLAALGAVVGVLSLALGITQLIVSRRNREEDRRDKDRDFAIREEANRIEKLKHGISDKDLGI